MQDYASRLMGMSAPSTASSTIGPGSARALAGNYASYLPDASRQPNGNGSGFRLDLADNAPVTPEQRGIIETLMSVMNNAPRVR
jgi:hypothetical protein